MCFATAIKVKVNERVDYKNGEIEIGISIYREDISVAGGPEEAKKKRNKEMCKNRSGKENEI